MAESSNRAEDDLFGRVLDGRYAIEGKLGEGGLGVVYRATQTRLGRKVAVKVLHAEHVKREPLRVRFEREARSLGTLSHPNIVDVIDYGMEGDAPFLVMELLEGRPLDSAIRAGLTPDEGLVIGRSVVAAVAYAHGRGVVHRDLKPQNVFLQRLPDGSESPRVLDFGLAKFLGETSSADGAGLTKNGAILGTPAYMSPEQATGAATDLRADVYSLGIVLYELLTGNRPFIGPPAELLRMHLLAELPPLSGALPDHPFVDELDAVLRTATAKSASKRYASAGELLEALTPFVPERISRGSAPTPRAKTAPEVDRSLDATVVGPKPVARAPERKPSGGLEATEVVRSSDGEPASSSSQAPSKKPIAIVAGLALAAVAVVGAVMAFGGEDAPELPAPSPADADAPQVAAVAPPAPAPPAPAAAVPEPAVPEPAEPVVEAPAQPASTALRAASAGAAVARIRERRPAPPPVPPEVAAIVRRYPRGARLGDGDRRALFRYSNEHRGDPSAWLAMAHLDFESGARSDALRFYGYAVRESVAAKNDPTMIRDVIIMAAHRSVGIRAAAMVVDTWGPEAVPAIDATLREVELDADGARRLTDLEETLLSMEGT